MQGYNIDKIELEDDNGLPISKKLTGEYLTGLSRDSATQPNAEVEGDEYVKFPDQETQKVKGPSHEKGGVPVNIPDGTKILSKSLNLTKNQVKTLKEVFDIDLTTKDNYSAALDRYTKKIGLKKLNDEQEEVFKSLQKIMEKKDSTDTKTFKQNQQFLSKKIYDIERQKEPVEQQRSQFFDILFEMQEKSKADKGDEEAMFRYGGIQRSNFEAVAQRLGLDPQQAAMMLKAKREGIKMFEEGGTQEDTYPYPEQQAYTPEGVQRLNEFRKKVGLPVIPENSSKAVVQSAVKEMQSKMSKENPDLVVNYMLEVSHQPNNKLANKLKSIGYNPTNEGVKKALADGKLKNTDVVDAYQDGKWWYRSLLTDAKKVTPEELKALETDLQTKGVKQGEYTYLFDPKTDTYTRYYTDDKKTEDKKVDDKTPPPPPPPKDPAREYPITDRVTQTPQKQYPRLFYMPDQSVLPPTPAEAHLKVTNRLERLDPTRIGIEQTIQDTNDQRNFVADQLSNLPDAQRAALMANLLANSQKTVGDAAFKANVQNAQNYQNVEQANLQLAAQEDQLNSQNALDYERRQFTAAAKADEALRGYYDYNRKVNTTNFQNQQKLNLIDSLFPDFDLDFYGASVNYNPKSEWQPSVAFNQEIIGAETMTDEELKRAREEQRLRNEKLLEEKRQFDLRKQQQRSMLAGMMYPNSFPSIGG